MKSTKCTISQIYFLKTFCDIFQGFIKKIPGLQNFSKVFQDFQGPYEPCKKSSRQVNLKYVFWV